MLLLIRLAWRNIWRHTRRTLITAGAMAVGLGFSMAAIALSDGIYAQAFRITVNQDMGHMQVHHPDYPKQRALHDTIEDGPEVKAILDRLPATVGVAPRAAAYALLGVGDRSAGGQLKGVEPEGERRVTLVADQLAEGRYLAPESAMEMVLGYGLADTLKAAVGDEVVAVSQAADGSMANDLFTVVGIFKTGSMAMDRTSAFVHLEDLQEFAVLGDGYHEIAMLAVDREAVPELERSVHEALEGRPLLARTWAELNPEVARILSFQDVGNGIILFLVFSVAALGILNTMLMSVFERTRELGIMKALGLEPTHMVALVLGETVALASVAAAAGLALGLGLDLWLVRTGIDLSGFTEGISFGGLNFEPVLRAEVNAAGVVAPLVGLFAISLLASLWPAVRAARLDPVEAMRQE